LTTEIENLRGEETEVDSAAREGLEARRTAEEASQEVTELRSQLAAAEVTVRVLEEAVRMDG
jgi:hypothetical protein